VTAARRNIDDLLEDLAEAIDAAGEPVALGKERRVVERPLRLAGEAVVGRLGDIATRLPSDLLAGTSELSWAEIKGMRIVVDHADHAIGYERVWRTLRDDVPELDRIVRQWVLENRGNEIELPTRARGGQRGTGDDLGLGLQPSPR